VKCLAFQEKVDELLSELLRDDLDEATLSLQSDAIVATANFALSETQQGEPNWFNVSEPVVRPLVMPPNVHTKSSLRELMQSDRNGINVITITTVYNAR
jgi:hypothetical protein